MKEFTSVVGYVATVDIDELALLCIGLLSESQSMSAEDRTIAANLLGDALAVAESSNTEGERVRLLRIAEAAIGGVAMVENPTIAALFQRHKTEMNRSRQKAATAKIVESPSVAELEAPAVAELETPAAPVAELEAPAAPVAELETPAAPVAELEAPAVPAPAAELEAPAVPAPAAELEAPAVPAPVAELEVRRRTTTKRARKAKAS
jgi:hypothetical protein